MTVIMWPLPQPLCVSFTRSPTLAVQTCPMPERHEQLTQLLYHIALLHVQQHSTQLHDLHQSCYSLCALQLVYLLVHPVYICHAPGTGQSSCIV